MSWFRILITHRWHKFRFLTCMCHRFEFFFILRFFFFLFLSKDLSKNELLGLLHNLMGRSLMCGCRRFLQGPDLSQGFQALCSNSLPHVGLGPHLLSPTWMLNPSSQLLRFMLIPTSVLSLSALVKCFLLDYFSFYFVPHFCVAFVLVLNSLCKFSLPNSQNQKSNT